jgi:hypothetical protein
MKLNQDENDIQINKYINYFANKMKQIVMYLGDELYV